MAVNAHQDQEHTSPSNPQAATGQLGGQLGGQTGQRPITDPAHLLPEHATENPKGSRGGIVRTIIILLLLALAIAFVVWRILSNKKTQDQEANRAAAAANRPIPVQTSPVLQQTVPVFLNALGTVTAYNTVTLHTRVDGQLLQVNFREGQSVHKGQLLLQIDPRPYQAALDQALGTLAKDEANLKNTEAEAQRYTALYQAGVVSKEQQQLQVSNQGQAAGTITADRAAIEAAQVNLGYTRIVSPIEGVVGLRQVDPGNIVHAADTTGLLVITQIHPIAIIFTLPEDQLPQVQAAMKTGNKLVVEAYDRSDAHKIAAGTLLTIDNQIDTTTGTAKLKAVFDNTDNALFSNQFVNVRLILRQRPNATVVPTAAIQSGAQGSYVFVVNKGPTPKEKLANQPGAASRGKGGKRGGKGQAGSGTDSTGGASESNESSGASGSSGASESSSSSSGKGGRGGKGGHDAPCPAGANHADAVNVHVDMTVGTSSVLADGELKPGQVVVIDGAEKLVDGGNVCPQQSRGNGAAGSRKGSPGASGSTTGGGMGSPTGSPSGGTAGSSAASPGGTAGNSGSDSGSSTGNGPAGNGQSGSGAAPSSNGGGPR